MKTLYILAAASGACDWYRERLGKILVHVIVSLSVGISLLGCSRYIGLFVDDLR
jgi:hypothetical protein